MSRYVIVTAGLSLGLFLIDLYVFLNWRRFVRYRRGRGLRWTVPVYALLMAVMPFALPVYFTFARWWEVEPKLPRLALFAAFTIYYLPKIVIAVGLMLKDFAVFSIWLFGWFQERLQPARSHGAAATRSSSIAGDVPVMTDTGPPPLPLPSTGSGQALSGRGPAHEPRESESSSYAPPPPDAPSPPLDLTDMKRMTRGEFLRTAGWSLAAAPYVMVGYSVFRSLYDFEVHRAEIRLPNLPRPLDGLTVAQLSDLHAGSFFSPQPMDEAVALVNELRPDVVAITGDFVNHDAEEMRGILSGLNALRADLGVYGCLGNHDHYAHVPEVVRYVRSTPVDLLVNQHRTVQVDGARLHVIGTDNTGFGQNYADLPGALRGIEQPETGDEVRLLLAHDPTFWDDHVRPGHPEIDLMLCGHTHGGQVGFEVGPFRWGLANIRYERWAGLYAEPRREGSDSQYLYVNRGLGTVGPPIRIGIRPEITLLTLRRG